MPGQTMRAETLEDATNLFFQLLETDSDIDVDGIELGAWAKRSLYLPDGHSSISPPFMEAYIDLQKQLYQIISTAKLGSSDVGKLTNFDIQLFQIDVIVKEGSSDIWADLRETINKVAKQMVGKLTGRQLLIISLGLAVILCGSPYFSAYFQYRKDALSLDALSKERSEVLSAISFASHDQVQLFRRMMDAILAQGDVGKKAAEAVENNNDAFLKAAARTERSRINGQELTGPQAEALREARRLPITQKLVIQEMKVFDINTESHDQISIALTDVYEQNKIRMKFKDDLLNLPDKDKLFKSLENRKPIWVEFLVRETSDEVKSVTLLRVVPTPTEIGDATSSISK